MSLVYGSYEHVPVVTLLKANGYCRLLWSVYNGLQWNVWQSMVYDPYEYVPISYGAVTFFGGYRLLWTMMIFEKNQLKFSS